MFGRNSRVPAVPARNGGTARQYDTYIGDDAPPGKRLPRWIRLLVSWPVLISLGVLVFEITSAPALAAFLACARFGHRDVLSAFWLRRRDPMRGRAKACFWLYLASAFWSVASTATIFMFILASFFRPARGFNAGAGVDRVFATAAMSSLGGYMVCLLAAAVAFTSAWRHRVRLWLSSDVHAARERDAWPPQRVGFRGPNRAGRVLLTAVIAAAVIPVAIVVVAMGPLGLFQHTAIILGVSFGVFFATPTAILLFRDMMQRRCVADTPEECWGESTPSAESACSDATELFRSPGEI
jgi:hypothetical protein